MTSSRTMPWRSTRRRCGYSHNERPHRKVGSVKLTLLGTGTPSPNPRRRGNSQVIESGGELVLIDVGATAAHRLVEAGYGRRPIAQLAITHLHSDHITGLADLLWGG